LPDLGFQLSKAELSARLAHQGDRFPLCDAQAPSRDGFKRIIAPKMTRQPGHRKFCMVQAPPAPAGESAEAPGSLRCQPAMTVQDSTSSSHTWAGMDALQCADSGLHWRPLCENGALPQIFVLMAAILSRPHLLGSNSSTPIGCNPTKSFPIGRAGGTLQHRSCTGFQLSPDRSRRVLSAAVELLSFVNTNLNHPHSSQLSRVANWLKLGEGYPDL